MSEPYIRISDQEEDWKPVIKNFISECALQDLIEIKKVSPLMSRRPEYDEEGHKWKMVDRFYPPETRIVLGEGARKIGHVSVKTLFNHWFNKTGHFAPEENPYKNNEQNF